MSKYISFEIENIQPVKQSTSIEQADINSSREYISGSTIRGAYISNYISVYGITNINESVHREKLLKGGMKFLNAYPIFNGERTFPMPKHLYGKKEDIKRFRYNERINVINPKDSSQEDVEKISLSSFCRINLSQGTVNPINVQMTSSLHIRKGKDKNKIFRYEAIKAGQKFLGIILCEKDEYVDECKSLLKNGYFYFGGSKGSGYGECRISNIEEHKENPEIKLLIEHKQVKDKNHYQGKLYVFLTADMIFRDENSNYKTFINENYIKGKLELDEVLLSESYIDTEIISGFNSKWGYRIPAVIGIKKGSLFVYDVKGELDFSKINNLVNKGIGERKEEGFGRVLVSCDFPINEVKLHKKINDVIKKKIVLSEDDKQQLSTIINNIFKIQIEKSVERKIVELDTKVNNKALLENSQWGRLYNLMFAIEKMSPSEGIDCFIKYKEHIKTKKLNRTLTNKLKQITVSVGNQKVEILSFIEAYIKDLDIRSFSSEFVSMKKIKINDITPTIDETFIFKFKVNVLKGLFNLQRK